MRSLFSKIAFIAFLLHSNFVWSGELPLLTIKSIYVGEEQGKSQAAPGKLIKYLRTPEEKAAHTLIIKDGSIYRNGALFDSSAGKFTFAEGEGVDLWGKAIVVLDEHDHLYFSLDKIEYGFHHSSLNAGLPAKFAGDMIVKNGKLIKFSNNSGHYKPSVRHVHQFMEFLESKGVDITEVQFDLNQGSFKAFFDSHPTQAEIQQLSDYTLEEALRFISKNPDEEWFELYKLKIQNALEKNPNGLKHLLNTMDTRLSSKALTAIEPSLKFHAKNMFNSKESLNQLNNHFDADAIQRILTNNLNAVIKKAQSNGLNTLNAVDIQTIGLSQKNKRLTWVDDEMLKLLNEAGFGKKITPDHLDELYQNMRLWNLNKMDEFVEKTNPASLLQESPKSCNPFSLMKKLFKKH